MLITLGVGKTIHSVTDSHPLTDNTSFYHTLFALAAVKQKPLDAHCVRGAFQ